MGRKISFGKEHKVVRNERLEKLTLKKGERTRVALLDTPEAGYLHTLEKVVIDEDTGQAVMETVTFNNGGTKQVPVTEFVTRFACTGDFGTVTEKGLDPDNCTLCRGAAESGAFEKPRRYMVAMVLQYECKPNSFQAMTKPFQGRVLPWVFTDKKWEKLHTIEEEYNSSGGVLAMDLMLGPCDSGTYQLYEIAAAQKCEWRAEASRQEYVKELLDNYEGDISTLLGREGNPVEVKQAMKEIQDTYDAAFNPSGLPNDNMSSSSRQAVDTLFGADSTEFSTEDEASDEEEKDKSDASEVKNLSELVDFGF